MAWTINDQSPKSLGVTVDSWTKQSLSIDALKLDVIRAQYDGDVPEGMEYMDTVALKKDGAIMFQGRVTRTPRMMDPGSEGLSYTVSGPFWDLDNLAFQKARNYYAGLDEEEEPEYEPELIPYVVLGRDGAKTGERIEAVLDFAISQGAWFQKGTIAEGIVWYATEHKDQTCGQVIRDYMRLTPDLVMNVDYATTPPTIHVTAQADLNEVTVDVTGGAPLVSHDITKLDEEKPAGIIVRYEKPHVVNGAGQISIVKDTAGETSGFGVMPITIPLAGANLTTEKAVVGTRDIPTDGATDLAARKWWIKHIEALQHIAGIVTEDALAAILVIPASDDTALNIRAHKRTLPALPDPPEPVNPESTPVTHTENVADYPRELISGGIPPWTRLRVRPMDLTATLAVTQSHIDAIENNAVRLAMLDIFKEVRTIGSTLYRVVTYQTQVNATNGQNKEYPHTVSADYGEDPPEGIAAAVFAQYSRTRHSGTVTFLEDEITEIVKPGDGLSFSNGRTEWADMKEVVQSVTYSFTEGTTSVEFGPPEMLGVEDMIGRLRAHKRLPMTYGFDPDDTPDDENTVGGMTATPINKTERIEPSEPAQSHALGPWLVERKSDASAVITPVPTMFYWRTFSESGVITPKIGSDDVTADPKPTLTLAVGTHHIYADYPTDEMGKPTGTVTFVSTTGSVPASTHHVPPSAAGSGTAGDYKKHIGTYIIPASTSAPVVFHPVSSPEHVVGTRKITNIGDGVQLHKDTKTAGEDEFRSLKAAEATEAESGTEYEVQLAISQESDVAEFSATVVVPNDHGGGGSATYSGTAYIHVDNSDSTIHLVNANADDIYPEQGTTGFWPFYTVVAGELGHTQIYCAEPLIESIPLPQETDGENQQEDGGTTD